MSVEAVFRGRQWRVAGEYEVDGGAVGVILEPLPWGGTQVPVEWSEPGLFVDPTDEQWLAAGLGKPIPSDPELDAEVRAILVRIYGEDRVRLEEGEWVFRDATPALEALLAR